MMAQGLMFWRYRVPGVLLFVSGIGLIVSSFRYVAWYLSPQKTVFLWSFYTYYPPYSGHLAQNLTTEILLPLLIMGILADFVAIYLLSVKQKKALHKSQQSQ